MRIGLAQINTLVGDLVGNRRKILEAYAALVAQGAEFVVFPELVVCGYPPRDLLFKRRFVPDIDAETYPPPLVDLKQSRAAALDAYASISKDRALGEPG